MDIRRSLCTLLFALSWLVVGPARAQIDDELRVLAIYAPSAAGSLSQINSELDWLRRSWAHANIPGVRLTFANGGRPLAVASIPSGNTASLLSWATESSVIIGTDPQRPGLRNQHTADVVLLFAPGDPNDGDCGLANAFTSFSADGSGLDLRRSENAFVGVIDLGAACDGNSVGLDVSTAAHEFAHMLGAGHSAYEPPAPRLFATSQAHVRIVVESLLPERDREPSPDDTITLAYVSNLASFDICNRVPLRNHFCIRVPEYSNGSPNLQHNNRFALLTTALSVANYRRPLPPAPPQPPVAVVGNLVAACSPPPWTRHQVSWTNNPANAPGSITRYDVFYEQVVPGYRYGWSTSATATPVYVRGANAGIRVRACTPRACSVLSSSFYPATWICNDGVGSNGQSKPAPPPELTPNAPAPESTPPPRERPTPPPGDRDRR